MKRNNAKKVIITEIIIAALLVLVFATVVIIDTLGTKASVELTNEQAQTVLDETFNNLPFTGAVTASRVIEGTQITVTDVSNRSDKEIVVTCDYSTIDIFNVYSSNKDAIFSDVYNYSEAEKTNGNMVNATKIRLYMDKQIAELTASAPKIEGSVQISIYEMAQADEKDIFILPYENTYLRVYLSEDILNTLFGNLVNVGKDVKATEEFNYNGEAMSIATQNTLRNGIYDCFSLRNFSSDKPDTSSFFAAKWNSFCDEFYRNFIQNAQWTYLTNGLLTTLEITLLSAIFGIVIGFICAIIRVTRAKTGKLIVADQIVNLYLSIIRGTPLMVQLMIIYFVLLLPIGIEKFPAAVICFAINSGAYVAEIVRGGIMSVDNGQIEAGRSLGLNYIQTMYYIVVPQAFKAVLPALANEFITLLKESSVAFYIGVADLTQGGLKIRSITYSNFMPLIAVALIYLVLVLILTRLVGILERRLRKSER